MTKRTYLNAFEKEINKDNLDKRLRDYICDHKSKVYTSSILEKILDIGTVPVLKMFGFSIANVAQTNKYIHSILSQHIKNIEKFLFMNSNEAALFFNTCDEIYLEIIFKNNIIIQHNLIEIFDIYIKNYLTTSDLIFSNKYITSYIRLFKICRLLPLCAPITKSLYPTVEWIKLECITQKKISSPNCYFSLSKFPNPLNLFSPNKGNIYLNLPIEFNIFSPKKKPTTQKIVKRINSNATLREQIEDICIEIQQIQGAQYPILFPDLSCLLFKKYNVNLLEELKGTYIIHEKMSKKNIIYDNFMDYCLGRIPLPNVNELKEVIRLYVNQKCTYSLNDTCLYIIHLFNTKYNNLITEASLLMYTYAYDRACEFFKRVDKAETEIIAEKKIEIFYFKPRYVESLYMALFQIKLRRTKLSLNYNFNNFLHKMYEIPYTTRDEMKTPLDNIKKIALHRLIFSLPNTENIGISHILLVTLAENAFCDNKNTTDIGFYLGASSYLFQLYKKNTECCICNSFERITDNFFSVRYNLRFTLRDIVEYFDSTIKNSIRGKNCKCKEFFQRAYSLHQRIVINN